MTADKKLTDDLFVVTDQSREDAFFLLPVELLKQVSPILLDQLDKAASSINPATIDSVVNVCKALKLPMLTRGDIESGYEMIKNGDYSSAVHGYAKNFIQDAVNALKKNVPNLTAKQSQSFNEYKEQESTMNDEKQTASANAMTNMITLVNAAASGRYIIGSITESGLSVAQDPRVHEDIKKAQAECERLAITNPGKRFVLIQLRGSVMVGKPTWN